MTTGTPDWLRRPAGPLPRTLRPFRRETTGSYLRRLAAINHLAAADLHRHLARTPTARIEPDWLATATGLPERTLAHRLPDLDGPVPARLPTGALCRFCAARRNVFETVTIYRDTATHLCLHHRIWTAGNLEDQLGLSALPEVTAAQHRHHRLVRHHGPARTGQAFQDARNIITAWMTREDHPGHRTRRLRTAFPDRHDRTTIHSTEADIANYPETVALAALLASEHWTGKATGPDRTTAGLHEFRAETARRLRTSLGHHPDDPLNAWLDHHQHGTGYPPRRKHRTGPTAKHEMPRIQWQKEPDPPATILGSAFSAGAETTAAIW